MMSEGTGSVRRSGPSWLTVALVVNAGLAAAFVGLWVKMAREDAFGWADFYAHYTGWEMILHGEADRLHDPGRHRAYQERLVPQPTERLPYTSPPHRAAVLAPLALLPPRAAFYVWTAFQVALLGLFAWLLRRLTADRPVREYALWLVTVLAFPALWLSLVLGQASLVLAVCLLGFYQSLRRGWAFTTALCLAVGTIQPGLMLVPAVTLLAARRWRELGIAAALLAAWAGATALVLGEEVWRDYFALLPSVLGAFGPGSITNPSEMLNLRGFLAALPGADRPDLIRALSGAGLAAVLAMTAWVWRGRWEPHSPRYELRSALTLQVGLMVSPLFLLPDAITLVVPAGLFLVFLRRRTLPEGGFVALALAGPLLFLIDQFGMDPWPGGVRPFFLVMAAAGAWMAWAWVREERAPVPQGLEEV